MSQRDQIFFAIFFLIVGAIMGIAAWDSHHQNPQGERARDQVKPRTDTETSKASTGQPRRAVSKKEGADTSENSQDKTPEWLTAYFSGGMLLVGFVQMCLFVWQLSLIRESLGDTRSVAESTRIAARAAQDSAIATERAERAYISISHPHGLAFQAHGTESVDVSLKIGIKNWGRTPGTVEDVRLKIALLGAGQELLEEPDYADCQSVETAKTFLVPGAELFATEPLGKLSSDDVISLSVGQKRLFVYGYVQYRDKFAKRHHGRYGRAFIPGVEGNNLGFLSRGAYNDDIEIS